MNRFVCWAAFLVLSCALFVPIFASAQSPTPVPSPPPPPLLPPCMKPALDPANPLHVFYRCLDDPAPPPPTGRAQPDVTGAERVDDIEAIRRRLPAAALLSPDDYPGFLLFTARASILPNGAYLAVAGYRTADGRATITLQTWTKTGDFLEVVPGQSPVTNSRQGTVAGFPAFLQAPTDAVVERLGDRTIIWANGDRIYGLLAQGFSGSDEPLLALAERLARRYQGAPAAPTTGDSAIRGQGASGWPTSVVIGLGGILFLAAAFGMRAGLIR